MPVTWTIQFDREPVQTLDAAGISDISRNLTTQDRDTATLIFRAADLRRGAPHSHRTPVKIFRDGIGWFAGKINLVPRSEQGSIPSLSLTIDNAWADLERLVYLRQISFVDSSKITLGTDTLADYTTATQTSSLILLNQDDAGAKINTAAQITAVLNYAVAKGIALQIGTIEEGVEIAREEFRDATLAEMIRAGLRWTPDLTTWWDYSTTPPTIHIVKRRAKTALNLDTQTTVFSSIQLTARPDLVISGASIHYLRAHNRPSFQFKTLDTDFAGVATGAQIHRTIELYGSRWATIGSALQKLNDAEVLPIGVAARVLESLGDLHYEGTVAITAQDCPAGSYLGRKLNLANAAPENAAMDADIRGQTDQIRSGQTTLELGPPPQLGAADFVELLRAGRPVQALTVDQQTNGPLTANTGNPPSTTPPELQFPPNHVDVVLEYWTSTNFFSNGQSNGAQMPGQVTIYNNDATDPQPLNADGSSNDDRTVAGIYTHPGNNVGSVTATAFGIQIGLLAPFYKGNFCINNGGVYGSQSTGGVSQGAATAPACWLPIYTTRPLYGINPSGPAMQYRTRK